MGLAAIHDIHIQSRSIQIMLSDEDAGKTNKANAASGKVKDGNRFPYSKRAFFIV